MDRREDLQDGLRHIECAAAMTAFQLLDHQIQKAVIQMPVEMMEEITGLLDTMDNRLAELIKAYGDTRKELSETDMELAEARRELVGAGSSLGSTSSFLQLDEFAKRVHQFNEGSKEPSIGSLVEMLSDAEGLHYKKGKEDHTDARKIALVINALIALCVECAAKHVQMHRRSWAALAATVPTGAELLVGSKDESAVVAELKAAVEAASASSALPLMDLPESILDQHEHDVYLRPNPNPKLRSAIEHQPIFISAWRKLVEATFNDIFDFEKMGTSVVYNHFAKFLEQNHPELKESLLTQPAEDDKSKPAREKRKLIKSIIAAAKEACFLAAWVEVANSNVVLTVPAVLAPGSLVPTDPDAYLEEKKKKEAEERAAAEEARRKRQEAAGAGGMGMGGMGGGFMGRSMGIGMGMGMGMGRRGGMGAAGGDGDDDEAGDNEGSGAGFGMGGRRMGGMGGGFGGRGAAGADGDDEEGGDDDHHIGGGFVGRSKRHDHHIGGGSAWGAYDSLGAGIGGFGGIGRHRGAGGEGGESAEEKRRKKLLADEGFVQIDGVWHAPARTVTPLAVPRYKKADMGLVSCNFEFESQAKKEKHVVYPVGFVLRKKGEVEDAWIDYRAAGLAAKEEAKEGVTHPTAATPAEGADTAATPAISVKSDAGDADATVAAATPAPAAGNGSASTPATLPSAEEEHQRDIDSRVREEATRLKMGDTMAATATAAPSMGERALGIGIGRAGGAGEEATAPGARVSRDMAKYLSSCTSLFGGRFAMLRPDMATHEKTVNGGGKNKAQVLPGMEKAPPPPPEKPSHHGGLIFSFGGGGAYGGMGGGARSNYTAAAHDDVDGGDDYDAAIAASLNVAEEGSNSASGSAVPAGGEAVAPAPAAAGTASAEGGSTQDPAGNNDKKEEGGEEKA
jgi:hypothetical protein